MCKVRQRNLLPREFPKAKELLREGGVESQERPGSGVGWMRWGSRRDLVKSAVLGSSVFVCFSLNGGSLSSNPKKILHWKKVKPEVGVTTNFSRELPV